MLKNLRYYAALIYCSLKLLIRRSKLRTQQQLPDLQFLSLGGDTILSLGGDTRRFQLLNEVVQTFLVLFGSTWSCESGLSAMNHINNKLRCRPTDTCLSHLLPLSISPLCPQFTRNMQQQCQHPSHWLHSLGLWVV